MRYCAYGNHRAQYRHTERCLPTPRGNVTFDNLYVLNPILSVAEQGANGLRYPSGSATGTPFYTRKNRWSKSEVLDRVFAQLQQAQIIRIKIEAVALDRTLVKVHPDGTGVLTQTARKPLAGPAADGPPRFIWLPRMLERSSRLSCPLARPTMRQRDENCCTASGACSPNPSADGSSL
jgi:hypothetical protein